ncbi:MAG: hypothetical protein IBJ15_04750 [Alphaproteobacteria bacterium]|nr:hypothetical protein [Alphaproteobacteria bacterium]
MSRFLLFTLVASGLFAAGVAAAQSPGRNTAPFVVQLEAPVDARAGGPLAAKIVEAPPSLSARAGASLAGTAVSEVREGVATMILRWDTLVDARGERKPLSPPGETRLRVALDRAQAIPRGQSVNVAWAGRAAAAPTVSAGPMSEREAIAARAREAGRTAPSGSGVPITLDMLIGTTPNPLMPAPAPRTAIPR